MEQNSSFFVIIEKLKIEFLEHLCKLIEYQIASRNLDKNVVVLEEEKSHLAQDIFADIFQQDKNSDFIKNNIKHFDNINYALKKLHNLQDKNSAYSIANLKNNLFNLNRIFDRLFVEHDLLNRQTEFLKGLINSYSAFSNVEQAMNMLLKNFYCYFPCNVVAVCLRNESGNVLFEIYYLGNFPDKQKHIITRKLKENMHKNHSVIINNSDISEKTLIEDNPKSIVNLNDDNIVSVGLTQDKKLESTKVLAIICITQKKMSSYERHVIGTNLYIMGINLNNNVHLLSDAFLKIQHYATHDVLTGLYNRRYFDSIINHEINRAHESHSKFSILMIDLDNFKKINDSYGHVIGDTVIKNVATTILKSVRKRDIAARIGGDEFAVILVDAELEEAIKVAEKIRKEIQTMCLNDSKCDIFHTSASIGISNYPNASNNAAQLMSSVDIALYRAKDLGKNMVFLSENPQQYIDAANHELNYLEKIRVAMEEGRVIPHFQPIVNTNTGDIYAYESLARLQDVNGEIIVADKFIKLVEKSILSYEFHKIIVYKSLKTFKLKLDHSSNFIKLFINLSVQEIQNKKILEDVSNMCKELNISPNNITFEFVERDFINNICDMQIQMNQARAMGFSFAVDDFGSAYNSLNYLREMSFEYLKIEGSFVKNIVHSKTDYILVKYIQDLCNELEIKVIAEFVESKEILEKLQEANVPYVQGYYLGMPMDLNK